MRKEMVSIENQLYWLIVILLQGQIDITDRIGFRNMSFLLKVNKYDIMTAQQLKKTYLTNDKTHFLQRQMQYISFCTL